MFNGYWILTADFPFSVSFIICPYFLFSISWLVIWWHIYVFFVLKNQILFYVKVSVQEKYNTPNFSSTSQKNNVLWSRKHYWELKSFPYSAVNRTNRSSLWLLCHKERFNWLCYEGLDFPRPSKNSIKTSIIVAMNCWTSDAISRPHNSKTSNTNFRKM